MPYVVEPPRALNIDPEAFAKDVSEVPIFAGLSSDALLDDVNWALDPFGKGPNGKAQTPALDEVQGPPTEPASEEA